MPFVNKLRLVASIYSAGGLLRIFVSGKEGEPFYAGNVLLWYSTGIKRFA